MMGRKAAKSATVSEQRLARLKNSKTLAFEPVLAASRMQHLLRSRFLAAPRAATVSHT
jgi:hypothetical protein